MAIDVYDEVPPSPTLTNPDMILPSLPGDTIFGMTAPSPATRAAAAAAAGNSHSQSHRPPYYQPQRYDDLDDPALAFATFSSYAPAVMATKSSPSVVVRHSSPNGSTDTTPTRRIKGPTNAGVIASSPTLRMLGDSSGDWALPDGRPKSGMSNVSSELSEDLERWAANKAALADIDGNESVVTAEEDDERLGKSALNGRTGGNTGSSPFSQVRDEANEDFLSRRAEIILANAKSRLKMMEGNLKGARHSLSNSSLSNRYSHTSSKAGGRRNGSGTHSRAVSEVSLPIVLPPLPSVQAQSTLPQRASSALGNFGPGLSMLNRRGSLRGARSQEAMRENRLQNWILDDRDQGNLTSFEPPNALLSVEQRPHSSHRKSPTPSELHRPVSQASSIRAQMDELKGRIYQIKERANQSSKRISSVERQDSRSPLSRRSESPSRAISHTTGPGPILENEATFLNDDDAEEDEDDDWLGASEVDVDLEPRPMATPDYEESNYEDAEETLDGLEGTLQDHRFTSSGAYAKHGQHSALNGVIEEEGYDRFEGDSESGVTEYYEAEQVLAERHEDRFDAFDYQNMFLHSAMSSAYGRRSSYSSDSSVETTRPASPLRANQNKDPSSPNEDVNYFADAPQPSTKRLSLIPDRNMSSASISTTASFATAIEGEVNGDDDDDDEDEDIDAAIITAQRTQLTRPTLTIPRPDAAIPSPQRSPNTFSSPSKQTGTMLLGSPPALLPSPPNRASVNSRPPSQRMRPPSGIVSSFIGLDNVSASQETIQKDRALVESVVSALQRCCLELQRAPEERRVVLRERLEETKRTLVDVLECATSPRPTSS